MDKEMVHIKSLIVMLANRVEKMEEKIDALDEEKRAASKKQFNEDIDYFNKELNELDKLI